ncbi:MAG: DegT/DnrJ/EryC1/StrS family aminotransferase, partial [Nitrospiraceae bacterium]
MTSPITFVASANCAAYLGAKPVFADIDRQTLTFDWRSASARITARTKVLIPVDFAGRPAH